MNKSTEYSMIAGKAYEYACLCAIKEIVSAVRPVEIIEDSSFSVAQGCFSKISKQEQQNMLNSALAGIKTIIKMEPKIVEDGQESLTILLQPDNVARTGDIRDVIIIRKDIEWEIGISVKHNHSALKHSRLSYHIDFGKDWLGLPCSKSYFEEIKPIFDTLVSLRTAKKKWSEIPNKEDDFYVPLLNAFISEFNRLFAEHNADATAGIIKYLLGSNRNDYYKLIHHNNHKTTVIPFNICGTLNLASKSKSPGIVIPRINLPTRIIELDFKKNSKTTVELTLDNGWSLSFRIHNASSRVEPSLKFDIQLVGQPADLFYLDVEW